MNMLKPFGIVLIAVLLSGCANLMTQATATEAELCRQWGNSLPTRSRKDTAQTQAEIQASYATFGLSCPAHNHLVPAAGAALSKAN